MRKTLIFLLFLLSCAPAPPRFAPVYLSMKFSQSFSPAQRDSLHREMRATLIQRDGPLDIVEIRSPLPGKIVGAYLRNTNILYAEPVPQ